MQSDSGDEPKLRSRAAHFCDLGHVAAPLEAHLDDRLSNVAVH